MFRYVGAVMALILDVSEHMSDKSTAEHIMHLAAHTNITGICSHRTHC
jgi:hypothetical protein